MDDELGRIWKEAVVAHLKTLSWILPGRTDEVWKFMSQSVFGTRFDPRTSRIHSRVVNLCAVTFI